jgi:uncharacterized RDD family membrane protein YckC
VLDTERRIATPEGIELTLRLAGPVPRALAWLLDLGLRLAVLLPATMILGPLGGFGIGLLLLAWFALEWLFPAWCEVRWGGATPGKKALKLVVLHDDGTPVGWSAALVRNLLRAVDFLPLLYGLGLATMLMSREFRRLGDLAAGTIVVHAEPAPRALEIPTAPPLAPPVALTLPEQRAILHYAERANGLTAERARELARIPRDLLPSAHGRDPVERLIRIANFLAGRR